MKVRIEAQLVDARRGQYRCELVLTDDQDKEVRLPATLTAPDDEQLRALLASGEPLALEVNAPPLERASVSLNPRQWPSETELETAVPRHTTTEERNDHE
ncbi:hypothetical protein [Streptomyces sp. DH37]|uniref:hypothetical protein n=1 Tax=Streptomyces sp. DH37 TaxID=3040122 RepID=UPI0024432617|nr:hypothetical protein [Streptomyces sp. DH37]MDG9703779.1 hypothetical protein [Streptomyces sp. DH37]